MVTQSPPYIHKPVALVTTPPPVTPLLHAFVDLDEKITKNLILWDDIHCISSPTNYHCDAYWAEVPTQISLILSIYTPQIMTRPHNKQKTPSIGDNTAALTYTSSIKYIWTFLNISATYAYMYH